MKLRSVVGAASLVAMSVTVGSTAGATSSGDAGDDPFVAMLRHVPADAVTPGGSMYVQYTDMAALWRRAGVDGSADARLAAFREIEWVPSFPQLPELLGLDARDQASLLEVGVAIQHVEQEIAVVDPPSRLLVATTSADPADVVAAVSSDPVWSADLDTVAAAAGEYYSWGDDGFRQEITRRSSFRPLGQAGFLAVLGESSATLVRALESASLEAALGAAAGNAPSLAEGWLFEPVVHALEGREVLFATAVPRPSTVIQRPGTTASEMPVTVGPYLGTVIVGTVTDETVSSGAPDAPRSTVDILVVHDSAESAAANVAPAQAWLDSASFRGPDTFAELLGGAEVSADGVLLQIRVSGDDAYRRAVAMARLDELLPTV